jgi:hypothetical protein
MKDNILIALLSFMLLLTAACGTASTTAPTPLSPSPTPVTPVIESFIPADSAPGGAVISLNGRHFGVQQGDSWVMFGQQPAEVVNWSETTIQVKLPLDITPGLVQVGVTANGQDGPPKPFTVLAPTLASIGLRRLDTGFAYEPVVADFDQDGDPDMFHPCSFKESGADNAYFLNNGDGTFTEMALDAAGLPVKSNTYHALAVDFDLDGDTDLYAGASDTPFYALNNGDGTFTLQDLAEVGLQLRPDQIECLSVVADDFNGDGAPDLYANCGSFVEGGADDFYALNNGDGTFTPRDLVAAGIPPLGNAKMLAAADFNGDGVPDLWVGHLEAKAFYLFNNGDGTFSQQDLEAAGLANVSMGSLPVAADFDGDNDIDLFIQEAAPATDFVAKRFYALNNGDGTFTLQDLIEVGLEALPSKFNWLTARDLNGDGHLDLFGSNPMEPEPGFYALNNGDGTFTVQDPLAVGLPVDIITHEPGVADFDRDGDQDLYLGNVYLLNRGDHTFTMLR